MATATRRRPPVRHSRPWWVAILRGLWVFGAWAGRSTWRLTAWGAPRVSRAGVTYSKAVTRRYRERTKVYAEHGRVPVVQDLTTGWWMPASAVRLQAPAGGDPQVRQQHRLALARQQVRDDGRRTYARNGGLVVQLTVWERITMWIRREDSTAVVTAMTQARMAVATRTAQRLSTAVDRHWPPTVSLVRTAPKRRHVGTYDYAEGWVNTDHIPTQRRREPTPVDLDKVTSTTGNTAAGGAMANDVRTFADLENPDVDPFEYPEELPGQLAQVRALIDENAEELAEEVQNLRSKSTSVDRYAEYMAEAEVVPVVVSPIEEAAQAYQQAMEAMQRVRDLIASAAESIESARQAAEQVYGDNDVPRFDKAG